MKKGTRCPLDCQCYRHDENVRQKVRLANIGKKISQEAGRKIAAANRRRKGPSSPRWNGGRRVNDRGRVVITWQGESRLLHRVIWEIVYGYKLSSKDAIHHKNHDFADNRIENLCLMKVSDHASYHNSLRKGKPCSEETKAKISRTLMGNQNGKGWKAKVAARGS